MPVFTIVQRALPFPWRRRSLTSKGKEKEDDLNLDFESSDHDSDLYFQEKFVGSQFAAPSSPLHRDVSDDLHIAVKQSPDPTIDPHGSNSEYSDLDSETGSEIDEQASSSSSHARVGRVVSWASIVRSRCRWTHEQEKELLGAEKQLARCQKAWSSEQELWLSYVCLSSFVSCVETLSRGSIERMGIFSPGKIKERYTNLIL
jgi:hypothetical protein